MDGIKVRWIQGFTNSNIAFVDQNTVGFPVENHIRFMDLETKTRHIFENPQRGISAFTASSSNKYFAFSEHKLPPSIFIYDYPDFNLQSELKDGAQLDYTYLAFSSGGPYLASCSSAPDFAITIWNWENTTAICTLANAAKEVISVQFNPINRLQFCALGETFITMWNIENSGLFYVLKPGIIEMPRLDGSNFEREEPALFYFNHKVLKLVDNVPPLPFTTFTVDNLPSIEEALSYRDTVTPQCMCWTATSELYVGCKEGFLLFVDAETLAVNVIFNPTNKDIPELKESGFLSLIPHDHNLIVIGKENVIHYLQIKATQITVTKSWKSMKPITHVMHYPDDERLLLSTDTGELYNLNPALHDEIETVLEIPTGNYMTTEYLPSDSNYFVSLKEHELLLWTSNGLFLESLFFDVELTSLACCSIALYVVVGAVNGKVLFIDLNEEQFRLVHEVKLYHKAVEHVVIDQTGRYIFTSGPNFHVYVLNGYPSTMFSVIGYINVPGHILSLSAQFLWDTEAVKLVVLFAEQTEQHTDQESDKFMAVTLPLSKLLDSSSTDRHGCFLEDSIRQFICSMPDLLTTCVVRDHEVFAYCQEGRCYQIYHLPEDEEELTIHDEVPLKPERELKGHPLGPATLLLSPNYMWLASLGRDGLLCLRHTGSIDHHVELQCHLCDPDAKRTICFSPDGLSILTTDYKSGSIICTDLRISNVAPSKYNKPLADFKERIFNMENAILVEMPTLEKTEQQHKKEVRISLDGHTDDAIPECKTWLDIKHEEVVRKDNEEYSEFKNGLLETFRELRETMENMIRENEHLPEELFVLDVEKQKKFDTMVEKEVEQARAEIQREIEKKSFLHELLKAECWDSLKDKGRAIKAFHSEMLVQNFPLRERTAEESKLLRTVEQIRKFENTASSLSSKNPEEHNEAGTATIPGSCSAQLGFTNPYLYDQFSMNTAEQRINQTILLKDVIYKTKSGFNTEFDAMHKRKVRELKALTERNKLIKEMMIRLNLTNELWEPVLNDHEWPESLLTVEDSEIEATKFLTPEEIEEEKRKLEAQALLAVRDDSRERALEEMMEGQLEVKKVDILKVEILPPEFSLAKPNIHWTEEEKKIYKDYEKKVKDLDEEKEEYRQSLEIEIKKLNEATKDATEKFDEALQALLDRKVNCTIAIYQEELKIAYLIEALCSDEEMKDEEMSFRAKQDDMLTYKAETTTEVKQCTKMYEQFREDYEKNDMDDKTFDSDFKKEFADVPSNLVDILQKMFKTRPKVQKARLHSKTAPILHSTLAVDASNQTLKTIDELDNPKHMPEGLNPLSWDKFCQLRRTKVQNEIKVHLNALALADMQEYLRKRMEEDSEAQLAVKKLSKVIDSVHHKRNQYRINNMVQVELKQGQVEVATTNLGADTAETEFILYGKDVVDNLRGIIRNLAKEKVATMEGRKEVRKEIIHLEWEHRVLRKKIDDLHDKIKDIKVLRLTEDQQELTNRSAADQTNLMLKKVADLEKTIAMMKAAHQKNIKARKKKIEKIKRLASVKADKSTALEQQLPELQVSVAELKHITTEAESGEIEATRRMERHKEVVERSRLEELARKQSEYLDVLWSEVERLSKKNFPSLDQLKYK